MKILYPNRSSLQKRIKNLEKDLSAKRERIACQYAELNSEAAKKVNLAQNLGKVLAVVAAVNFLLSFTKKRRPAGNELTSSPASKSLSTIKNILTLISISSLLMDIFRKKS